MKPPYLKPEARSLKPPPRSGMILLVVVIVVALLSLAGFAFVSLMNSELDSTRQRGREMQMHYVTQSGVSLLESTAALSQYDRNRTGGTYDNAAMFCASPVVDDWSGVLSPARFTVVSPKLEGGRMTGIRYGLANESAKLNLAKVLEWETANPGDGVRALQKLPGMTAQTAEAILDWIDADDDQRPGGAESNWYAQMRSPYKPRNAVPVSLEEFLLVRGVTRQLMFGDDENFNFVPDAQESQMAAQNANDPADVFARPQSQSQTGATPGIPWVHLLTVVGAERDANPAGAARIDLNQSNLEFLREQLAQRVGPEVADFVVLYRQYGTAELNADSQSPDASSVPPTAAANASTGRTRGSAGRTPAPAPADIPDATSPDAAMPDMPPLDMTIPTEASGDFSAGTAPPPLEIPDAAPAPPSATTPASAGTRSRATSRIGGTSRGRNESRLSQYVDLQTPARFQLETPLDIVNAVVVIPQLNSLRLESPLTVNSSSLNSTLLTYLDEASTSPSTTIIGRININEAPYEVIAGIPGLSQNAALAIVNRREQPANGVRDMYRHPTWLLAFDVVSLDTLKSIWPHVTCGGDVFRAQVIGFYEDIGTFSRVEVAVDATVFPPRRIEHKDLTSYGIGFHDRVLFGTIPQQTGYGGIAQSSAPTLADRATGTSIADTNTMYNMGASTQNYGMGAMSGNTTPHYSSIAPLEIPRE